MRRAECLTSGRTPIHIKGLLEANHINIPEVESSAQAKERVHQHVRDEANGIKIFALADEDLHGYGIIQKAARQSNQSYRLGPGTLYDNLKKLMDQGLVEDIPKSSARSDEEKRLYRLTYGAQETVSPL